MNDRRTIIMTVIILGLFGLVLALLPAEAQDKPQYDSIDRFFERLSKVPGLEGIFQTTIPRGAPIRFGDWSPMQLVLAAEQPIVPPNDVGWLATMLYMRQFDVALLYRASEQQDGSEGQPIRDLRARILEACGLTEKGDKS